MTFYIRTFYVKTFYVRTFFRGASITILLDQQALSNASGSYSCGSRDLVRLPKGVK